MRLKQIKLAGFKSFVDPTTVTLPGNRCAVVGPNGCGKSNIIDAVRWVMGESSAKQLRGENLTDVIFNGSNARKPTAMASIELLFDNSDGRIGGEYASYAEISVRRQVTRDSQSSYFLNGNRCRRRDIMDIFLGTGFGPRSYSIIEQGMISQLVEAKPEDLRVYLEEAAGISRYKERRRETENRIRHTRENLERLTDLREELGQQLDRLNRQAKAAERYRELKTEERKLTAELHTLRYSICTWCWKHGSGKSAIWKSRWSARPRSSSESTPKLKPSVSSMQNSSEASTTSRVAIISSVRILPGSRKRYSSIRSGSSSWSSIFETVTQRSAEAGRQLEMDEYQIAELLTQIEGLKPQVEASENDDREAAESLREFENRYREWQTTWESFSAELAQHEREAEVQASRVEHLEQLLLRLRARREQLDEDAGSLPLVGSDDVDSLAREIGSQEAGRHGLNADIDRCLADLATAREEVLTREQQLDEARQQLQNLRHELASLEALQQAALGREEPDAGGWLESQGLTAAERLGEALAVVPGWERAVETVLGDYLQSLHVPRIDDFQAALADLAGAGVTLLEGRIEPAADGDLPGLASMVRSHGLKLGSLLHGIYAAESVEVAFASRQSLGPGESIITRQGVWVGPDWVRVLAEGQQQAGIIERAQQIEALSMRVEEAERNLGAQQGLMSQCRQRVEQLETERESLQSRINT